MSLSFKNMWQFSYQLNSTVIFSTRSVLSGCFDLELANKVLLNHRSRFRGRLEISQLGRKLAVSCYSKQKPINKRLNKSSPSQSIKSPSKLFPVESLEPTESGEAKIGCDTFRFLRFNFGTSAYHLSFSKAGL